MTYLSDHEPRRVKHIGLSTLQLRESEMAKLYPAREPIDYDLPTWDDLETLRRQFREFDERTGINLGEGA